MGMFKRGYDASREEKARQDQAKEQLGKKLWRFFLAEDGEEADVRFLTEEPVNFYEHNIKTGDNKYEQYTCIGDNCPLCADGEKATYKGAYLVVDRRDYEYKDSNGNKKTGGNTVKLYVQGMKVVSQLDRISSKYGLSNRDVTIVRLGKGTQTSYTVERGEEEKLTSKEIRELLPEKLRDEYDGTMESLYKIVENQLMMNTKDYAEDTNPSYDNGSDKIINVADDEDESPVEVPKKKLQSKSGKSSMFKKPQNRIKPRA